MTSANTSLARRLTRPLLIAVVTVWTLSTAMVAWYVDWKIQRNFDTELIESAHRQLYPALLHAQDSAPDGNADGSTTFTLEDVPGSASDEPLLLQLRDAQGRVLLRSKDAPSSPFDAPLQSGFHNSIEHRIYTLQSEPEGLWLQIADPLSERRKTSRDTLKGLIAVLLLMLPVLAALIHHIARRELRSVQWLEQQITTRSSSKLEPLALQGLPIELQRVANGMNELMEQLRQALDVERALAANAAHELRTPLAAVRLRLHTALEQAREQDAQHVEVGEMQAALTALETLSHRTERLLQLSRAEADTTARFHTIDLVQLCSTMAQEFWQQPRAQQRLDWMPPEHSAQVLVRGDMDTLAIALRNLIDNALTYSSGEVVLSVQPQPPALVVRDSGPGLGTAQASELLQRHVRGNAQHVGYGLGMSIVQSIAHKHGARLELLSPPAGMPQGLEVRLEFAQAADTPH